MWAFGHSVQNTVWSILSISKPNPSPVDLSGSVGGVLDWGLVRVFSDVLVAFLYFDICHYRQSNLAIENPEFSQPVVAGHFQ